MTASKDGDGGQTSNSQIVFFLGAGASVEAHVPDTYGMVQEFRDAKKDDATLSKTVSAILNKLENWLSDQGQEKKVDVELLLETLDKLRSRDQEVLLRFFKTSDFLLSGYDDKNPIIDGLRNFIKEKAVVNAIAVSYMEPLLQFIQVFGTLDVFSVNYDTALEQFCSVYKKDLIDGFDFKWNPDSFNRKCDIRLYKLHGSITWYRTDRGDYVKIPVKVKTDSIELMTEEKAVSLILYPMRKWQYADPLLELLMMLKDKLEGAKFCVMVGYSMRDEHIRSILLDAAQENRDLHLLLIGPRSTEIYHNQLEHYYRNPEEGNLAIPSALSGRVVCLPYKFGVIFPRLRFLYQQLGNALYNRKAAESERIAGNREQWASNLLAAFNALIEAEHIDGFYELVETIDWNTFFKEWRIRMQYSFKAWFHSVLRRNPQAFVHVWTRRFLDSLSSFGPTDLKIGFAESNLELKFKGSAADDVSVPEIIGPLSQSLEWSEMMMQFVEKSQDDEQLKRALLTGVGALKGLIAYLDEWRRPVFIEEYLRRRQGDATNSKTVSELTKFYGEKREETNVEPKFVKNLVLDLERGRLQNLLSTLETSFGSRESFPERNH